MQYEIFDDFRDGMVLTAIPLSWFRSVTNFIKNIGGGGVIKMRNENGAPTATIDTAVSQKDNLKTEMTPFRNENGDEIEDTFFDGDTGKDDTSWGVNEQNANDRNGCIVTLPTRMENPLKDGSQTERDRSKIRMWFRSFGKSSAGLTAQISSEIGYKDLAASGSYDANTAEDVGSFPTDEIDPAHTDDGTLWQIGDVDSNGKPKGATLFMLYKSEYYAGHKIDACRLELTSDGRISKIVAVPNLGVYISA